MAAPPCCIDVPYVDLGGSGSLWMHRAPNCVQHCSCASDVDGDGIVGILDLLAVLAAWGPNPGDPADVNFDNVVDVLDMLQVLAEWGPC